MKNKIPIWNILFSVLFIFGFFAGTVMATENKKTVSDLSAVAIIDVKINEQKTDKNLKTVSNVLPFSQSATLPSPQNKYNTNAPVLTSGGSEKIAVKNDTAYEIDVEKILSEPYEKPKGKVLILHTHTSEAYTKTADADYAESDPYRTQESEKNIVSVGRELAKVLKKGGIDVIHSENYHDYPSYTGSYRRAAETAKEIMEKEKDISLVIDVHRDALLNENGEYMKTLAEINGVNMAKALIVVGSDGGGLEHPAWRENLKTALNLQKIMKEKYPALSRDVHLCNERYNGHVSPGAIIIEIGSNGNTLSEATQCVRLVGECIVNLIKN